MSDNEENLDHLKARYTLFKCLYKAREPLPLRFIIELKDGFGSKCDGHFLMTYNPEAGVYDSSPETLTYVSFFPIQDFVFMSEEGEQLSICDFIDFEFLGETVECSRGVRAVNSYRVMGSLKFNYYVVKLM